MEDLKTTDSVTISASASVPSDIAHPHDQRPIPDVPEDIEDEIMPHFNDPNWDFRDNSPSSSASTDGVAPQRFTRSSSHVGSRTEGHTESYIASWHIHDPNAHFSSEARVQLRVLYFSSCAASCSSRSFSSGIHHILRSAQRSRTPMTQPWS